MRKRKHLKSITSPRTWATPTKERRQQNGGLIREDIRSGNGQTVRRYRARWESPIDVYRGHGVITRRAYQAALRFHRIYYGVVLLRRRSSRPISEEHASWKKTRVEKLLELAREIIEPADMNAVIEICGHGLQARNIGALTCLKRGLGDLASQWSIAAREVCAARRR